MQSQITLIKFFYFIFLLCCFLLEIIANNTGVFRISDKIFVIYWILNRIMIFTKSRIFREELFLWSLLQISNQSLLSTKVLIYIMLRPLLIHKLLCLIKQIWSNLHPLWNWIQYGTLCTWWCLRSFYIFLLYHPLITLKTFIHKLIKISIELSKSFYYCLYVVLCRLMLPSLFINYIYLFGITLLSLVSCLSNQLYLTYKEWELSFLTWFF